MKRGKLKIPKCIEVRGSCFLLANPPLFWTENSYRELSCDRCQRPLVVLFATRDNPDMASENPRWWIPTEVTCACLAPRSIALHEVPRKLHRPRRDKRQLKLTLNNQTINF
jgi:hypothetical protein